MKAGDARVLLDRRRRRDRAGGGAGPRRGGRAELLVGRSPARLAAQLRALKLRVPALQADWQEADLLDADSLQVLAARAKAWDANVVVSTAPVPRSFGRFDDTQVGGDGARADTTCAPR